MLFLVDESTGLAVAQDLRQQGHDVVAAGETLLGADDCMLLAKAHAEGRILLTNDKDFGELVFRCGLPHAGIVLLRLQDESPTNRVRVVQFVLHQAGNRLAGNFTVATETHVRVRTAP